MSSPLTAGGCPPAAYPVLVPVSRGCPGLRGQVAYVLLTRSPLAALSRRANDLHVLGTPPAFVLSQDQTLRLSLSLSLKYTLRDFPRRIDVCCMCCSSSVFQRSLPAAFPRQARTIYHRSWRLSTPFRDFFSNSANFYAICEFQWDSIGFSVPRKKAGHAPPFSLPCFSSECAKRLPDSRFVYSIHVAIMLQEIFRKGLLLGSLFGLYCISQQLNAFIAANMPEQAGRPNPS